MFLSLETNIQVSYAFVELAIFMAIEFLLRPWLNPSRSNHFNFLLKQEAIILLVISLMTVFHHVPYILIIAAIAILIRVLQLWLRTTKSIRTPLFVQPVVSKRISRSPIRVVDSSPQTAIKQEHLADARTKIGAKVCASNRNTDDFRRKNVPRYQDYSRSGLSLVRQSQKLAPYTGLGSHGSFSSIGKSPVFSHVPEPQKAVEESSGTIGQYSPSSETLSSDVPQTTSMLPYNLYSPAPSTTPPGLVNNGNTCFVNSTLQCLNWTPGFVKVLPDFTGQRSDTSIFLSNLNHVLNLCSQIPDGKNMFRPVSTAELLSSMSPLASHLVAPTNSPQYQQDTAEFLLWLLNHLHNTLRTQSDDQTGLQTSLSPNHINDMKERKRTCEATIKDVGSRNLQALREPMTELADVDWRLNWQDHSSALYELFMGQILEARECHNCKKVTMNIEYFTLFPLPIPLSKQTFALKECFQRFSKEEELVQDNMITCSCTGDSLAPATRVALLNIIPKSLIIQLTRFSYNSSLHAAFKNNTPVYFPQHIDMSPHTMQFKLNLGQQQQPMHYELHAFCVHSGAQSTSFGHYVAYCKTVKQEWYFYNDDRVIHISDIEAELKSEYVLCNTYLLFYHAV